MLHGHRFGVLPCGEQCGFIDEVGEVGAGQSRRSLRKRFQRHIVGERDVLGVNAQYPLASLDVGSIHDHLPVKPSRTQKGGVENIGPIRRRDDDDAAVLFKPVHLDQQLIQCLFPLIMPAAESRTAVTADSVDLVDEDDARCALFPLLEKVADTTGPDADEHFHEVRPGDCEEGHARFPCHGARQKGLAGAGRAQQKNAPRDFAAEPLKLRRLLQELDNLRQLDLRFVGPGHIKECDVG